MSPETIHCLICGKPIRAENFKDGMAKLRRHYKRCHPKAFRESIEKRMKNRKGKK